MALPFHNPGRLPAGLCVFGMTYSAGFTWADTPKANPRPHTARDLITTAAESGLSWVELPGRMLEDRSDAGLFELRDFAERLGIRFVVPGGQVRAVELRRDLELAVSLGAPVVRCTLSGVLCGDRRGFEGGWPNHLRRCEAELDDVLPDAERLGVAIAIENHQDANSDDLLALCGRYESRYLGITLDCGNPLAVMEDPVEFATRVAKYLRHAHLKDYRVHPAPNGFRLVRCAVGEGAVDFPALFRLFDAQEWAITRNIEMGALQARQIPMLERTWWDEFAPRDARDILPALQVVWKHFRAADEEWRTPEERDTEPEELLAYEWDQYHRSVDYLRGLEAGG